MSSIPAEHQEAGKWLTSDEARAYLGRVLGRAGRPISNDTLLRYRREGFLHTKKRGVGQRVLYERAELAALLEVQSTEKPSRLVLPLMTDHFDTYVREVLHLEPVSEFVDNGVDWIAASDEVAALLQIEPATLVARSWLRQGVRTGSEVTYWRTSEDFYHPELVDQQMAENMRRSVEFDTLAAIQERYGITTRDTLVKIRARMPSSHELELLRMPPGSPALEVHRVTSSEQRAQVVVLDQLVYRSDLCELEVEHLDDSGKRKRQ
jgi:hypothetical protein